MITSLNISSEQKMATTSTETQPLRELVRNAMESYFSHVDASMPPRQLYDLVLEEIEAPLLESVMKYTRGNQCRAAEVLGISRSTLRKKLKQYALD